MIVLLIIVQSASFPSYDLKDAFAANAKSEKQFAIVGGGNLRTSVWCSEKFSIVHDKTKGESSCWVWKSGHCLEPVLNFVQVDACVILLALACQNGVCTERNAYSSVYIVVLVPELGPTFG